jgi:predicted small lipoprotein YifL
MKARILLLVLLVVGLWACGNSGPSEADKQAEAEAKQLDSLTQIIDASVEAMEEDAANMKAALEELDALFPEEE